jgi:RNA polymerase sigma-70 factor, ECF subfamily
MGNLAARLAGGDDSAFTELYDAYADRLYRYAALRLGSAEVAGDVVQTVFLRAVKSRRRFQGIDNPAAYLFRIARNETIRAAARRTRRNKLERASDQLWDASAKPPSGEDAEAVKAALDRLGVEDRETVELKVFGGLTFAEIAALVDRPASTVATRYRRALVSLRAWLERQMQ